MTAMTRFWEWLGRVIMLVLAGMITLSIIGAIAAIPSGSIETRLGVEQRDLPQPVPVPQPEEEASPPLPAPSAATPEPEQRPVATPTGGSQMVGLPQPKPAPTAAEWLEAITYALLALVGLAAVAILLFWRALGHWRRSADALEAIAARRS